MASSSPRSYQGSYRDLNAVRKLYEGTKGYGTARGVVNLLFEVSCGVLQGCPLSGSIFFICADPLLTLFKQFVICPGRGQIRRVQLMRGGSEQAEIPQTGI